MDTKNKNVLTKRTQIVPERNPEVSFTSLAHHMNLEWLLEAFYSLRKTGAAGVDGKTAEEYGADLLENLRSTICS